MVRALAFLLILAASARASSFSSINFFGDSLSDTGNVYQATTLFSSLTFGLIPVQPASPPYYDGRFSNGPLWTEYVAARLGDPNASEPAGMSLGIFGSLPGTGNNYAIGGAKTGVGGALGDLDALVPTGILAQTQYYLATHGNAADPNALYLLAGGGNDLLEARSITDPDLLAQTVSQSALYLAYSLYNLYLAGGRNFVLFNAPNIGYVPDSFLTNSIEAGIVASLYFNYFLNYFEGALSGLPGMDLLYLDLFGFYNGIVFDTVGGGSVYGFTSLVPCITPGPGVPSCDSTVFFDNVHPTTRVHGLLGNVVADQILAHWQTADVALLSESSETPEPASALIVAGGLAILFVRRRALAVSVRRCRGRRTGGARAVSDGGSEHPGQCCNSGVVESTPIL